MNRLTLAEFALAALLSVAQALPESRRLIAIFVVDGLRPDSINAIDTPTIDRLRRNHSTCATTARANGRDRERRSPLVRRSAADGGS